MPIANPVVTLVRFDRVIRKVMTTANQPQKGGSPPPTTGLIWPRPK